MIPVSSKTPKPPKISTSDISSWTGGYVSALDDGRTPQDGLRDASNLILTQDGTVRPRPSLQKFGPQPVGTVLGRTYEFRQLVDGVSTNWLINLQDVPKSPARVSSCRHSGSCRVPRDRPTTTAGR